MRACQKVIFSRKLHGPFISPETQADGAGTGMGTNDSADIHDENLSV